MTAFDIAIEETNKYLTSIYQNISDRIQSLDIGEKIIFTGLVEEVGKEFGYTFQQFYPTCKFFRPNYPGVKFTPGAHGGIVKLSNSSEEEINLAIDKTLQYLNNTFREAYDIINALNDGERIAATTLADIVGSKFGLSRANYYSTLKFFIDRCSEFTTSVGARGGITKINIKAKMPPLSKVIREIEKEANLSSTVVCA
jgi:hypothetical protein